jgi:hypothetical protein
MEMTVEVPAAATQITVQHLAALNYANEIRLKRAEDKRKIGRGELSASEVLRDVPLHWESAKVVDLLLAMHRVGRQRAGRWLRYEMILPSRQLKEMTARQRFQLAAHVDSMKSSRDRVRHGLEGRCVA